MKNMYYFVSMSATVHPDSFNLIKDVLLNAYHYIEGVNEVKRSRGEKEIPVSLRIVRGSNDETIDLRVSLDRWVVYFDSETVLIRFNGLVENLVMNKVWKQGSKRLTNDKTPVTILRYGFLWDRSVLVDLETGEQIDPRNLSDSSRDEIFGRLLRRKMVLQVPLRLPGGTFDATILEYSDYEKRLFPWEGVREKFKKN